MHYVLSSDSLIKYWLQQNSAGPKSVCTSSRRILFKVVQARTATVCGREVAPLKRCNILEGDTLPPLWGATRRGRGRINLCLGLHTCPWQISTQSLPNAKARHTDGGQDKTSLCIGVVLKNEASCLFAVQEHDAIMRCCWSQRLICWWWILIIRTE